MPSTTLNPLPFLSRPEKAEELLTMMQQDTEYGMIRGAIDVTALNDATWSPSRRHGNDSLQSPAKLLNSVQSSSSSGYSSSCEDDAASPLTVADGNSVFDDVSLLLQQHNFDPVDLSPQSSPLGLHPTNGDATGVPSLPAIPDLCTDNISFDDLVSTDDWLDSLSDVVSTSGALPMQGLDIEHTGSSISSEVRTTSFLDSYLQPSAGIWGTEVQNFSSLEPLIIDGLSRSPLDDTINAKSSITDHTLEVYIFTHLLIFIIIIHY